MWFSKEYTLHVMCFGVGGHHRTEKIEELFEKARNMLADLLQKATIWRKTVSHLVTDTLRIKGVLDENFSRDDARLIQGHERLVRNY